MLVTIFATCANRLVASDPYADSLRNIIKGQVHDTLKVKALTDLSVFYLSTDLTEALKYAQWARNLSLEANYHFGAGYAYKYIGIIYFYQDNYLGALEQWELALKTFDTIQDKVGMANMLSNIGAIYFNQGDNAKALDYYLHSLRLAEESGDKLRIATAMTNVGAVYFDKENTHDLAITYYQKALDLSEELEDFEAIGTVSANLGDLYLARGEDEKALRYFEKSLAALEKTDEIPYTLLNIGRIYLFRKDYKKAIQYFQELYDIAAEAQLSMDMAKAQLALGNVYQLMGEYSVALKSFKIAMNAALVVNANKELKEIYHGLSQSYAQIHNMDSAYKYLQKYVNIKDTIFNADTDRKLSGLMFSFELERKQNEIESLTIEKELTDENLKRQAVIRNLIIAGFMSVVVFLFIVVSQKNNITKEKKRSDELLLNILPAETAEELKQKGFTTARSIQNSTILFSDIIGFTEISAQLSPEVLVEELDTYFRSFDEIMEKNGIEKIKTIGDAYMAAGGIRQNNSIKAQDVVNAAKEMMLKVQELKNKRIEQGKPYFEIRIGMSSGPVVAGVVGVKKFQYDIWGDTVNTAARMEQHSNAGKINISESTYQLIKDYFTCVPREPMEVKGKGILKMYFVT